MDGGVAGQKGLKKKAQLLIVSNSDK